MKSGHGLDITGNYAASVDITTFFNSLDERLLKKIIWVPEQWISGYTWVDIACKGRFPDKPLEQKRLAKELKAEYDKYHAQIRTIEFKIPSFDDREQINEQDLLIDVSPNPTWRDILFGGISGEPPLRADMLWDDLIGDNSLKARIQLGRLFYEGDSEFQQNFEKAARVFYTLFKNHQPTGGAPEFYLSEMYRHAHHFKFDPQKADFYYQKAKEQGYITED